MLKKPNIEIYTYRGKVAYNNLVNLNLVTEVYRDFMTYYHNGSDITIYKIAFLMVNNEEVNWFFDTEEQRNISYYEL